MRVNNDTLHCKRFFKLCYGRNLSSATLCTATIYSASTVVNVNENTPCTWFFFNPVNYLFRI